MGESYLLFDVGGTDVKAALATADGELLHILREPTARPEPGGDGATAVLEQLSDLADRLGALSAQPPIGVGLLVCGLVDAEAGVGLYSVNLGWRDVPLRAMAEQRLAMPVGFGHDVTCAARAELEFGAGAHVPGGVRNAAVLIIGTGIASALVVDGRLVLSGGYAGELGHAQVPGGLACPCGATGCLETLGSAGAIARRYYEATGVSGGAREVFAARAQGDHVAQRIIDEALDALSFTLAQLTASVAPEAVIIGGGLAQAGPPFFDDLQARLAARLSYHRLPQVLPARLGADAGLRGAWLAIRDRMREESS